MMTKALRPNKDKKIPSIPKLFPRLQATSLAGTRITLPDLDTSLHVKKIMCKKI
jgi:hypothetical protein